MKPKRHRRPLIRLSNDAFARRMLQLRSAKRRGNWLGFVVYPQVRFALNA